ncbi:MAG: hypothetical protein WA919_17995 [Coleofasciculaceae cyanobacterium]
MDAKEIHQIQFIVEPSISENPSKKESRDRLSVGQAPVYLNRTDIGQEILLITSVFTAIVIALLYFTAVYFRKAEGKRTIKVKGSSEIPCYRCRFFKNNSYLRCAVHPCTVLSCKATNCPDYESE